MKRIYKGYTKLRILINTKCNLTGCLDACICCTKPDGSFTAFNAGIKDAEKGLIFYDVQSENDFDQAGWWKLWAEVVFDDDRNACGQAVRFFVHEAGKL